MHVCVCKPLVVVVPQAHLDCLLVLPPPFQTLKLKKLHDLRRQLEEEIASKNKELGEKRQTYDSNTHLLQGQLGCTHLAHQCRHSIDMLTIIGRRLAKEAGRGDNVNLNTVYDDAVIRSEMTGAIAECVTTRHTHARTHTILNLLSLSHACTNHRLQSKYDELEEQNLDLERQRTNHLRQLRERAILVRRLCHPYQPASSMLTRRCTPVATTASTRSRD